MLKINFPVKCLALLMPLITAQICLGSYEEGERYLTDLTACYCLRDEALNEQKVYTYIKKHPSLVHVTNGQQRTPLHLLAAYGSVADYGVLASFSIHDDPHEVVNFLLQNGADPHARDQYNNTALHYAARTNRKQIVLALKDKMDVNIPGYNQMTPLHKAAEGGHIRIIQCLLTSGTTHADVNAVSALGDTPLHSAMRNHRLAAVSCLLDHGADIEAKDANQFTPLHLAVHLSQLNIFRTLINEGADIEAVVGEEMTPLLYVCLRRRIWPQIDNRHLDLPFAALLISNGARLDIKDRSGWTPFYYAVREKKHQLALLLCEPKTQEHDIPEDLSSISSVSDREQFSRAIATFNVIRCLPRGLAYWWCYAWADNPAEHHKIQAEAAKRIIELLGNQDIQGIMHLPNTLSKVIVSFLITPEAFEHLEEVV